MRRFFFPHYFSTSKTRQKRVWVETRVPGTQLRIIWDDILLHIVILSVIGQWGAILSSDWPLHWFTGKKCEQTHLLYSCESKVNALTSVPPQLPHDSKTFVFTIMPEKIAQLKSNQYSLLTKTHLPIFGQEECLHRSCSPQRCMVRNKAKHYGCQYSLGLSTTLEQEPLAV